MKAPHFIWSVKGAEVERENAYNCTFREIEQHKLRLAVKHHCSYSDVTMVYRIDEEKQ